MNIEVKKLARDPLVWVGAALLCVPLLAAGSLNHLRAYLTYDREPSVIERSVSQEFAEDIPVVGESFSREPLPSQSRRLPPIAPAENGGVEVAELNAPVQEPVSLPPATSEIAMSEIVMPEIAMADPGSLLELAAEFDQEHNGKKDSSKNETQTGPDTKAEQEEDDFDFLFGDDAATEEKSKDVAKDTKKEPSTSETDNKVAKESKSSEPKSVEDKPSETEQESALLSKTDKSSSDGESGG